jgi:hypothetical protein
MNLNRVTVGMALCLVGAGCWPSGAEANLLTNGSFEAPLVASGEALAISNNATVFSNGWTRNWQTGVVNGAVAGGFNPVTQPSGYDLSQYAFLQSSTSSVSQDFTLAAASNVSITWLDAGRPTITAGVDGTTSYSVTAGSLAFTGSTASDSNFASASLNGVLGAGTYTLTFLNNTPGDHTMYLDNVVV